MAPARLRRPAGLDSDAASAGSLIETLQYGLGLRHRAGKRIPHQVPVLPHTAMGKGPRPSERPTPPGRPPPRAAARSFPRQSLSLRRARWGPGWLLGRPDRGDSDGDSDGGLDGDSDGGRLGALAGPHSGFRRPSPLRCVVLDDLRGEFQGDSELCGWVWVRACLCACVRL